MAITAAMTPRMAAVTATTVVRTARIVPHQRHRYRLPAPIFLAHPQLRQHPVRSSRRRTPTRRSRVRLPAPLLPPVAPWRSQSKPSLTITFGFRPRWQATRCREFRRSLAPFRSACEAKSLPANVARQADSLAKAGDLESARAGFKLLSDSLIKYVRANNITGLHEAYCPMARASWLQADQRLSNPYMGRSMPGCGQFRS